MLFKIGLLLSPANLASLAFFFASSSPEEISALAVPNLEEEENGIEVLKIKILVVN